MILAPLTWMMDAGDTTEGPAEERVWDPMVEDDLISSEHIEEALAVAGSHFVENLGQVGNDEVLFYAQGDPVSVAFTTKGLIFTVRGSDGPMASDNAPVDPPIVSTRATFKMGFEGCRETEPEGIHPIAGRSHFYLGDDPAGWHQNVPMFEEVLYGGIYDGVDIRFYFWLGQLKYDIIAERGSQTQAVAFVFEGVDGLRVDGATGELVIRTPLGEIRDQRPLALHEGHGAGSSPCHFELLGEDRVGFSLTDEAPLDQPLIIDPGIKFSSYLGGTGSDDGTAITMDDEGNVYIAGETTSTDLLFNNTVQNGNGDIFGLFLDTTAGTFEVFTIGGKLVDEVISIEVSNEGRIYLAGNTRSTDFPTPNGFDTLQVDGESFVLEVNATGQPLNGTLFGGGASDITQAFAVDEEGDPYVLGITSSIDLPVTPGAFCSTIQNNAIFLMRINASDWSLDFCTYIDGAQSEYASDLCLDGDGNVYISGLTGSTKEEGFPVTTGAYCTTKSDGVDAFILRVDGNGTSVPFGTYIGGTGSDFFKAIHRRPDGSLVFIGTSDSDDLRTTSGAYSESLSGRMDAYLGVIDPTLSTMQYLTYFGGQLDDRGQTLVVSQSGDLAHLIGTTDSDDLNVTSGAFDPLFRGDVDIFIATFDLVSGDLSYCTYFGGEGSDVTRTFSAVLTSSGNILMTGRTDSTDLPVTIDAYYASYMGGSSDMMLVELDPTPCIQGPEPPSNIHASPNVSVVLLTWEPPNESTCRVDGYRIYRGTTSGELDPLGGDVQRSVFEFSDISVDNGTTYYYAISSLSGPLEGPLSSEVEATPIGPPMAPRNLDATTGDGAVHLTWDAPENDWGELLGYEVWRGPSAEPLLRIDTIEGTTSIYDDIHVENGTRYLYAIRAFNRAGPSPFSESFPITVSKPPSEPTGFTVNAGDERIDLSWGPPADAGGLPILGYDIRMGESRTTLVLLYSLGPSETSVSAVDLDNGKRYYFDIVARNANGPGEHTEIRPEVPFGVATEPRSVKAESRDRRVDLSWNEPASANGRPITGYMVYFGQTHGNLEFSKELSNVTIYTHSPLTNGVIYYYQVAARNLAGEGWHSETINATPMAIPGAPQNPKAEAVLAGIKLTWGAASWVGTGNLVYKVMRGTLETDPTELVRLTDILDYTDTTVIPGTTYRYKVAALNPVNELGPDSLIVIVKAATVPSSANLLVNATDGSVLLTWDTPVDDGYSTITGYIVRGGINQTDLKVLAELGVQLNYTDSGLVNGRKYFYKVWAVNAIGEGDGSAVVPATPRGKPGMPNLHKPEYKDGKVVLAWAPPSTEGRVPVTSYLIMRGTSADSLVEIGEVTGETYTDSSVRVDTTYFYYVVANSTLGFGDPSVVWKVPPLESITSNWMLLLVLVIVIFASVVAYSWSKRVGAKAPAAPGPTEAEVITAPEATVVAETVAPVASAAPEGPPFMVERAFVIFRDGRLIADCSRDECKTRDADLMSGMLIAIQGIVQDGLDKGGKLESIKYGENLIILTTGKHVNLAAIVYGEPTDELFEEMDATVRRIEVSYSGVIEQWIGDISVLSDVGTMVAPLLESTSHLARGDIDGPKAAPSVSLLSAVDFHRGYVRLKVAVANTTDEAVMDASVEVHYDHDMLRLERVKPESLALRGDRVDLGNIKPEEKKTVAFLFDPQICQGTQIDGALNYYDTSGEIQHLQMKRRRADVVCPIFFTQKNANTAMLRRLIRDTLHMSDLRISRYPDHLTPEEVLKVGKEALEGNDVQQVSEYMREGPPFYAEVWYYGETKVKGYQIVMRLGIVESKHAMEFFAASTDMQPITGLLAEFRQEVDRILEERYSGAVVMEPETDEVTRMELSRRELMMDSDEDQEPDGDGDG